MTFADLRQAIATFRSIERCQRHLVRDMPKSTKGSFVEAPQYDLCKWVLRRKGTLVTDPDLSQEHFLLLGRTVKRIG